jgi:flavin-dependent dehydrogenase
VFIVFVLWPGQKACVKQETICSSTRKQVLFRNPHLKRIWEQSTVMEGFPLTIAQISFAGKTQVEQQVLMLGDTAGMITPLCGNGMSIALHTGKIASKLIHEFLTGVITRDQMEQLYRREWRRNFQRRLQAGRVIQRFFGRPVQPICWYGCFAVFLLQQVADQTHTW